MDSLQIFWIVKILKVIATYSLQSGANDIKCVVKLLRIGVCGMIFKGVCMLWWPTDIHTVGKDITAFNLNYNLLSCHLHSSYKFLRVLELTAIGLFLMYSLLFFFYLFLS
jgi:hypothetical protein